MDNKKYGGSWKIFECNTAYQGELHINMEKHVVALELLIPAEENNPMPSPPYKGRIPYICGTLFSGARVLLYNCETEGEHHHFGKFTRQMIHADYAFWGLSVSSQDEIVFSKVYLDFGNILAWARLCDYHWDFSESSGVNLVWKNKEPVSLELSDQLVVTLFPTQGNISMERYAGEICARQYVTVELCYNEPVRWEQILEDTKCLQYMIGLGTGRRVEIEKAKYCHYSLFQEIPQQNGTTEKIDVEAEVIIGVSKTPTVQGKREFEYLFSLDDLNKSDTLKLWRENYEKIEPVLDLYFSAFASNAGSAQTLFLNLVQALETFHARFITNDARSFSQRVHNVVNAFCKGNGNEQQWVVFLLEDTQKQNKKSIYLRSRLADLAFADGLLPFWPNGKLPNDYIRKVVDTRNYYTHYSTDKLAKSFSKEELPLVNSQLLALLEYHLLVLLGFNPDDVRRRTVEEINRVQTAHLVSANTHRITNG